MEFSELISKRYAARGYQADPVPQEKLAQVLEAARLAPTAANYQPFQLVVVRTKGREAEMRKLYDRPWFPTAPVLVCVCAIPSKAWVRRDGKNFSDVDAALVLDHMMLAAANAGLGSCCVAAFDIAFARQMLDLPAGVEPVAFITLGFPADNPKPKERKPIGDLVRYEHW